MTDYTKEVAVLKAILKAELNKTEIQIVLNLLKKPEKTITCSNVALAKEVGIAQPNYQRAMKKLASVNVIGSRANGVFVKAFSTWGKKN